MAIGTTIALLMLIQAPVQGGVGTVAAEPVDVAFEELSIGQNTAAIERIEANAQLDRNDPARLINLGIAHARKGFDSEARAMFVAAARNEQRYQLETSQGTWIDSHDLARRALAMLDRGEFRTNGRVASR